MSYLNSVKIDKNIYTDKEIFEIENFVLSNQFPWYHVKEQTKNNNDGLFFGHNFYWDHNFCSPYVNFVNPLLNFIKPTAILGIRMNLTVNKNTPYLSDFHTDNFNKQFKHTTSVFYLNTNNGYTELEDGTKILSEKNKLASFPSYVKHRACSTTNKPCRIVINLNYFK